MVLDIARCTSRLESILKGNILPYWIPRVFDTDFGGYRSLAEAAGRNGDQTAPQSKPVILQARILWFLSHLINCGRADECHIAGARSGFAFLRDKMWDAEHGGFYWEVDRSGSRVLVDLKHAYAQAFALYALSEYAIALDDRAAAALAGELFDFLERHAHDGARGGYREFFTREWTVVSEAEDTQPATNWLLLASGRDPTQKTFNTHLHLMEAVTNYYRLSSRLEVRDRVRELVRITSDQVARKDGNGCSNVHDRDWRPRAGADRVNYGHDLENITLLTKALCALGLQQQRLAAFYRSSFAHALDCGYDNERGGFYYSGPAGEPAENRSKYAWTQGEGLLSALQMYVQFGDAVYARCFEQTLDWIADRQADRVNGEWFCEILPDGTVNPNQIESWHSPYHNGRAVLQSLSLLETLSAATR